MLFAGRFCRPLRIFDFSAGQINNLGVDSRIAIYVSCAVFIELTTRILTVTGTFGCSDARSCQLRTSDAAGPRKDILVSIFQSTEIRAAVINLIVGIANTVAYFSLDHREHRDKDTLLFLRELFALCVLGGEYYYVTTFTNICPH